MRAVASGAPTVACLAMPLHSMHTAGGSAGSASFHSRASLALLPRLRVFVHHILAFLIVNLCPALHERRICRRLASWRRGRTARELAIIARSGF